MIALSLCLGVVLGVLATLLYVQHRRSSLESLTLRRYNDVVELYLRTLKRHGAESITHYKPTFHPTSGQKRLLEELHYAGELVSAVRGRFLVDLVNTVIDRNGCVELWVYTQDDVAEVFYLPADAVPVVTGTFADINQLFKHHLTRGV